MGCCDNIIKLLLVIINVVFLLSGLAVLAVGVLAYLQYSDFSKVLSSELASPPVVFMIIGAVATVVAFYGCCGAMCESRCMLISYGVVLLMILVAQVAIAILAFTNKTDLKTVVSKSLTEEYDASVNDQAARDLLKNLQREINCCGVRGMTDFYSHGWPEEVRKTCPATTSPGCAKIISEFIDKYATIIGGVGIGIGVVELLGSISGFALASYIKGQY